MASAIGTAVHNSVEDMCNLDLTGRDGDEVGWLPPTANAILEKSRTASEKEATAVSSEGDSELANVHDSGEKNRAKAIDLVISNFDQS